MCWINKADLTVRCNWHSYTSNYREIMVVIPSLRKLIIMDSSISSANGGNLKGRPGVIFRYLEKNSEGNDLQESVR